MPNVTIGSVVYMACVVCYMQNNNSRGRKAVFWESVGLCLTVALRAVAANCWRLIEKRKKGPEGMLCALRCIMGR